jgi:endogenous inhibitor of DNA gyrase (YacG/DUF329 family)
MPKIKGCYMVVYNGKCVKCGNDYTCYLSKGRTSRFCSKNCMKVTEHHGEKKCETCGKDFKWYRGNNRNEPRFCSHACQGSGVKTWRSKRGLSWKGKAEEEKIPLMKIAFFDRIEKCEGCWEWIGSKTKAGYGIISFGGNPISAHRLSWKLHNGYIDSSDIVRHLCNNPICVNPEHLAIGTILDNARDRVRAGNSGKGSKNNFAVLNEEKVKEIKKLLLIGVSGAEIGRRFGVTRTCVNAIKNFRTWVHIT